MRAFFKLIWDALMELVSMEHPELFLPVNKKDEPLHRKN